MKKCINKTATMSFYYVFFLKNLLLCSSLFTSSHSVLIIKSVGTWDRWCVTIKRVIKGLECMNIKGLGQGVNDRHYV